MLKHWAQLQCTCESELGPIVNIFFLSRKNVTFGRKQSFISLMTICLCWIVNKFTVSIICFQASEGKCNTKKPGVFDFVGQAKWNAWNDLGDISKVSIKMSVLLQPN